VPFTHPLSKIFSDRLIPSIKEDPLQPVMTPKAASFKIELSEEAAIHNKH
jgi:hypothetical protein